MTPELEVVADPGIAPETLADFAAFARSHPADVRRSLGVDDSAALRVRIVAEGKPEVARDAKPVEHRVPARVADNTLAVIRIREMSGGAQIVPALHHLARRDAFAPFGASGETEVGFEEIERAVIAKAGHVNAGYLHVNLKHFALQGWLRQQGVDRASRWRITRAGRAALAQHAAIESTYAAVCSALVRAKDWYRAFRAPDAERAGVEEFRKLVASSLAGWGLPREGDRWTRRTARHLRAHLDGAILLPVLVALGMPKYRREDDRLEEEAPSFFAKAGPSFDWKERLADGWNEGFLAAAMDLLVHHGWLERAGGSRMTLTRRGKIGLDANLPGFAALPVSYFTTYVKFEERLFGRSEAGADKWATDEHVDRLVNIWGIASSVSIPRARDLSERIFRKIFDAPLEQQPAGIADMGCGDGRPLREIVEFVLKNTRRGKSLDSHPLHVIAADFSEVSRARAKQTLLEYRDRPGVKTAVVHGDVTDPDEYDRTIRALGWNLGAGDFLHALFHLTHDRTIRVASDDEARTLLRAALRGARRNLLEKALRDATDEPIPDGEDARFELIVRQFTTTFATHGKLVPALIAAADLVGFLQRWAAHAGKGLVIVELHSPRPEALVEEPPDDDAAWMRTEKTGHSAWSAQTMTDQYVLPFVEHQLAAVLAGLEPTSMSGSSLYTQQLVRNRDRSSGIYLRVT